MVKAKHNQRDRIGIDLEDGHQFQFREKRKRGRSSWGIQNEAAREFLELEDGIDMDFGS